MAANEDGTVKSDDELRAVYTGVGLDNGEAFRPGAFQDRLACGRAGLMSEDR
jgi:hypothetical protein